MGSRYLSTAEAAALLRTSRGVLANWRSFGEGPPFIRIGRRRILYDVEDLEEWISRHKVKTIDSIQSPRVSRHFGDNVWKGGREK